MSLRDVVNQLIQRDAQHLESIVVPVDHIFPPPLEIDALGAQEGYFRLWVTQMYLHHDRSWFTNWYPVVQSLTEFGIGNGTNIEIAQVAGPGSLQTVDPEHLGTIIQLDRTLTPLVPFLGGTVQIQAGLIAMPAGDLLRRFLDVMGSFAKLVAVPQVSGALDIADTVSKGIEQLLGVGDKKMTLGYEQTFVSKGGDGVNELSPRHILLTSAPAGTYGQTNNQVWIKDGRLLVGSSLENVRPLDGVDYMLLRIETRKERDDWESLSTINDPWTKAILSLADPNKIADADLNVNVAVASALISSDLTTKDRLRVARAIRDKYGEYKQLVVGARAPINPDRPTLTDVAEAARIKSTEPVTTEKLFIS